MKSQFRIVFKAGLIVSLLSYSSLMVAERPIEPAKEVKREEGRKSDSRTETPEEAAQRRRQESQRREEEQKRSAVPGEGGSITKGGSSERSSKASEANEHVIEDRVGAKSVGGNRGRFSKEATGEITFDQLRSMTEEKLGTSKVKEGVLDQQKAQYDQYKDNPEARRGFLVREEAFIKSLGNHKEMGEAEAREFENNILKRLKGEEKEVSKEDVEALAALTCANQCGHEGMSKVCRRSSKFLKAAAALSPVAFAAAWKLYSGWGAKASDAVKESSAVDGNLTIEYEPGKKLVIEKIDEPVVGEKRAPKEG